MSTLAYFGGTLLQLRTLQRAIPREGQGMNETTAAYIAGFLDGDGSIHLQLVRQREYRYGFYVRVSVSFHQHETGRKGLEWLKEQLETKQVEPNGTLGEAMGYMLKHWEKLTLFLRKAGAPLDNNICERALKKAILHRKNAMFYKTENGARVGDLYMSMIHTAELCDADPFVYLVELQRHQQEVLKDPDDWMPWNYAGTLARLSRGSDPPA